MPNNPEIEKIEDIINNLMNRIESIEKKVDNLSKKEASQHFHIEQMHLRHLENLSFRLDQLNIKELSGSLNIGNNFGVQKPQKEEIKQKEKNNEARTEHAKKEIKEERVPSEVTTPSTSDSSSPKVNHAEMEVSNTTKGISVRFQSKE